MPELETIIELLLWGLWGGLWGLWLRAIWHDRSGTDTAHQHHQEIEALRTLEEAIGELRRTEMRLRYVNAAPIQLLCILVSCETHGPGCPDAIGST